MNDKKEIRYVLQYKDFLYSGKHEEENRGSMNTVTKSEKERLDKLSGKAGQLKYALLMMVYQYYQKSSSGNPTGDRNIADKQYLAK